VPGGGAIEMELSKHLREYSRTIQGKAQLFINSFAKALEVNSRLSAWPLQPNRLSHRRIPPGHGRIRLAVVSVTAGLSRFGRQVIPRQLSDNAGFDSTDILNKLRQKHAIGDSGRWYGVDIANEGAHLPRLLR
jgi:T-complex protein 1 subunit eta